MTDEYTYADLKNDLSGADEADPEDVESVLVMLTELPISFRDKKLALVAWLDRAGLDLERWMVERFPFH